MTRHLVVLDIEEVIARWDEIMDRTEAGEIFIISINGEPKASLVPFSDRPEIPD